MPCRHCRQPLVWKDLGGDTTMQHVVRKPKPRDREKDSVVVYTALCGQKLVKELGARVRDPKLKCFNCYKSLRSQMGLIKQLMNEFLESKHG